MPIVELLMKIRGEMRNFDIIYRGPKCYTNQNKINNLQNGDGRSRCFNYSEKVGYPKG